MSRITYASESSAETLARGIGLKQCPITCGLQTTMTVDGFQRTCAAIRERQQKYRASGLDVGGSVGDLWKWCRDCQGKTPPPELSFFGAE